MNTLVHTGSFLGNLTGSVLFLYFQGCGILFSGFLLRKKDMIKAAVRQRFRQRPSDVDTRSFFLYIRFFKAVPYSGRRIMYADPFSAGFFQS